MVLTKHCKKAQYIFIFSLLGNDLFRYSSPFMFHLIGFQGNNAEEHAKYLPKVVTNLQISKFSYQMLK